MVISKFSSPLRRPVWVACWTLRPCWPSWRRLRGPTRLPWRGSSARLPSGTAAPRGEGRSDPPLPHPHLRGADISHLIWHFSKCSRWIIHVKHSVHVCLGQFRCAFYLTFVKACIVLLDKVTGAQPWGKRDRVCVRRRYDYWFIPLTATTAAHTHTQYSRLGL